MGALRRISSISIMAARNIKSHHHEKLNGGGNSSA